MKGLTCSLTLLVCISLSSFVFAQPLVTVLEANAVGAGCPEGSFTVNITPSGDEISIMFDLYEAMTGPTDFFDYSTCNIALTLSFPTGLTLGLIGIDYRGFVNFDENSRGAFHRDYFFAGGQGPSSTTYFDSSDNGPFIEEDDLLAIVWSPCGDTDAIARTNTQIWINGPKSFMKVNSMDASAEIILYFDVSWC